MVKQLCSDNADGNNIDVISIVAMGGSGKTTLAQLLYNDERMKEHFPLKAWVCVSEEFFLLKVTKSILEGIGSATPSDMQSDNLDLLHHKLKRSLGDKKFLLVLDDVWDKGCSEWGQLRIPLLAAGKGSKVVVTTRDTDVARNIHSVHIHHLRELSPQDCWSLFTKHAFENGDSSSYPQLESIGRKIVAKCQGLPLAIKAVGGLLYSKADRREWEKILESETWGFKIGGILPSLILSYHDLPLDLKRCFAYCSIFPKDHIFDKEKLILLWMAEGLLQFSQSNKRMEEVGEQYFRELLSKSFFQKFVTEESCFVMHDLMHDLAQYISRKFCIRLEDDKVQEILETTRHSLCFESNCLKARAPFKRFKALTTAKCLRTFLELKYAYSSQISKRANLHDILPKWRYLRVLSLCGYKIINLPESISQLKHLRYFDLSYTRIEKLPNSVCDLCNLQTMILSGYDQFFELPSRIDKLINLRYLEIFGWREMPSHISRLRNLQKLSNFIVGQKDGLRIGELGKLSDIGGRLEISEMQNVVCARDALGVNMKDKRHLDELALKWCSKDTNDIIQSGVLNNLQPHPNLKQLTIEGYPGVAFPNWIGGCSSLSYLVTLELASCKNCSSLPPLGQLPSLKHLSISRMEGVEKVGSGFYGDASSSITSKPSFPCLQTLRFSYMLNWEKWLCCGCEFRCLQELYIINCPQLTGELPEELPALKKLEISGCSQLLVASLQVPAIRKLTMVDFGELQLQRPPSGFTALQTSHIEISDVSQWHQLPLVPHQLRIRNCDDVESLLEDGILQTNACLMSDLEIKSCRFSISLDTAGFPTVTLKSLEISSCDNIGSFLPKLFECHHPSLEILNIEGLPYPCTSSSFKLFFSLAFFPSLICFGIYDLHGLESLSILTSEGEPTSLCSLKIRGCNDLEYIELPALDSACYEILKCRKLKLLNLPAHTLSSLQRLSLKDCPQLLFHKDGLPSNLRQLGIWKCNKFTPQVDWGLQRLASLTEFTISGECRNLNWITSEFTSSWGCQGVESFPEERLLPSTLTTLEIECFPNLKSLDGRGLQQLTSLTKLSIRLCPQLQFIPQEFQHFPFLLELEINDCQGLQSFGEGMLRHLTSLERLFICQCKALQSLTGSGLQHLTSLETLSILDCPKLQYLTKERLPDSLSSLEIGGCPLLEQRCQFEEGQEWDYIAHIPQIVINRVLQ